MALTERHGLALGASVLHRYEVLKELGRGGAATTYLVHDRRWDTRVTLKLLRSASPELVEVLHTEFGRLRDLYHPHLCQVHELSQWTDASGFHYTFYTADYVRACHLGDFARGADWDQISRPLGDALEALDLLHRAGLLHGDFKPENILVADDGSGTLIDLGCARPVGAVMGTAVNGTPGYLAPEALEGAPLDARADLFAVGITLRALSEHLSSPLPDRVETAAHRLVSANPDQRPSHTGELLEALWPERAPRARVPIGLGRFVGRQQELARADTFLQAFLSGRGGPRVLHIMGADGLGKSRLLREIQWNLRSRMRWLEAHPHAPDGVRALLETATGARLATDEGCAAVDAHHLLCSAPTPCVLVIDDIDSLAESERRLLGAFVRLLEPTDPVGLVLASRPGGLAQTAGVERIDLKPIDGEALREMLGDDCSPTVRQHLERCSGGHPGALRALLVRWTTGVLDDADLAATRSAAPGEWAERHLLRDLSPEAGRAVGVLAMLQRPLGTDALREFAISDAALVEVLSLGIALRDEAGFRWVNPQAAAAVLPTLDQEARRALHLEVAHWLLDPGRTAKARAEASSDDVALAVIHLLDGGDRQGAESLFREQLNRHARAPRAWLGAARQLLTCTQTFDVELAAARLEQSTGQAGAARARLEAMLSRTHTEAQRWRIRLELGACHLRRGDAQSAVAELRHVLSDSSSTEARVQATDRLAQALCRLGTPEEALRIIDSIELENTTPALKAALDETAAVALSCLGRFEQARVRLDAADRVAQRQLSPREIVRSRVARALVEVELGQMNEAIAHYGEALALAEQHGLSDQVANAALNLGVVYHRWGDFGQTQSAYDRALRLAVALDQNATAALACFNLARLYFDIGAIERARTMLGRCLQQADSACLASLQVPCLALNAEIAMEQDDEPEAEALLKRARQHAIEQTNVRDRAEVEAKLAELWVRMGESGQTEHQLVVLRDLEPDLDPGDVQLRVDLARARILGAMSQFPLATSLAEQVTEHALKLGLRDLAAEAELESSELWHQQGARILADRHHLNARELWERLAATLPSTQRNAFWQLRRRRSLREGVSKSEPTSRERKLELLVNIFRRLNSSLKTPRVLECAMDAAIELSGAERGFLLLKRTDHLEVAVARNVDHEELERSHLKFSRSIAEQVIESGQTVVTASAQTDERFARNESVHAMRLQSVVCVPVSCPAGRLGALYLDNRFRAHQLSEQDVDLVMAFADQVAIALSNARLHDELSQRHRELARQSRCVEALLREKEAEVERLTVQADDRRRTRPHRFDYSAMVGSGPAMERVFDLLDRVIDTDLTVLIEGESGTGKELVARAIHHNHGGRTGPLVSVNCAAVPEALLEAELFGAARGAFTGADRPREGLFVQAHGGTLFLDELGEMPLSMQVKLLRAVQEREVRPLGARRSVTVDVRLVCATNRSLTEQVARGAFREDLYYRISSVVLRLPPLRDRIEDVPELSRQLLDRGALRTGRPVPELTRQALRKLCEFSWPGNVRQLENVLLRALVMAESGRITAADIQLPLDVVGFGRPLYRKDYAEHEAQLLSEMMEAYQWNIAKAAQSLGVSRPTLYRRLRTHGLKRSPQAPRRRGTGQ